MIFQHRLNAFVKLGQVFGEWLAKDHPVLSQAYTHNPWFTPENIRLALRSWADELQESKLNEWVSNYRFTDLTPREVVIIMAGNIPLVGLHDLICVLLSGHKAIVKPSGDDEKLILAVVDELIRINPEWENYISISKERLPKSFDAVIATGSNNTYRYFEYYFRDKPHLLRKNRSSVAILTGNETPEDLQKLADDIFTYFGMGCRNVSKIYVPKGYDFNLFFENMVAYEELANHNKYANNYTYHKSIFLMNMTKHLDNGFLLVKEDPRISSPLSVLFYEMYENESDVETIVKEKESEIQCVVAKINGHIPFGKAQSPELRDYADGVDTMAFLLGL